ncbi:MAG TPA: prolipoprotein diacylglyceryl transferase [Acidobacteriota bacterium]|nr:prolipoprotein diacylglyceryl transferase [Acidobacteriota bacterium]
MYPKLIDLGPVPIHTYGLLLALALLISIELMARLGHKQGIDRNKIWDLGFIIILSALAGAKLLLVIVEFDTYAADPGRIFTLEFLQAGGVFYGGFLGALAGAGYYIRKHPEFTFWNIADLAAPCIALGQAIGRLGCFAAGCDYGKPADVPWAVTFTSEYAARNVGVPLNVPLHPSQLYESAAAFALFLFLIRAFHRRRFQGQVFLLYLALYAATRFVLEFWRGDPGRGLYFDGLVSTSQIISLILFPAAIYFYWNRSRRLGTT